MKKKRTPRHQIPIYLRSLPQICSEINMRFNKAENEIQKKHIAIEQLIVVVEETPMFPVEVRVGIYDRPEHLEPLDETHFVATLIGIDEHEKLLATAVTRAQLEEILTRLKKLLERQT